MHKIIFGLLAVLPLAGCNSGKLEKENAAVRSELEQSRTNWERAMVSQRMVFEQRLAVSRVMGHRWKAKFDGRNGRFLEKLADISTADCPDDFRKAWDAYILAVKSDTPDLSQALQGLMAVYLMLHGHPGEMVRSAVENNNAAHGREVVYKHLAEVSARYGWQD